MRTDGWTAEDYKDHREWQRENRENKKNLNVQRVKRICLEIGVSIEEIAEHHLRLSKQNFQPLDFYPITCKVNVLRSNKYQKVLNIEDYLIKYFK